MVFLSFIMSIFIAIQDPIIQKFAIRIAGGYISQKTGADIRIGRLYISPDFTIHIDQFSVKDLNDNVLLDVDQLRVRPVMEDLIHGDIHLNKVELTNAHANLVTYEGEEHMNFQFLIDAFSSDKKKEKDNKTTTIQVDHIVLNDLDFQLWNQNKDDPEKTANHEMDYAHLNLTGINLDLDDLTIVGDSINAVINHLAASEASGFDLKSLRSKVNVSQKGILLDGLQLETNNSRLHTDLHMNYDSFKDFSDFVNKVDFDAKIYPSDMIVSDLGPFSKSLYAMTDKIHLEGWMKGPVSDFKIDDLKFETGNSTSFVGDVALQPLNLQNGKQTLNIKKLDYSYNDLANFHIPGPSGTLPIPDMLASLGHGTVKGNFSGSINNFKADLTATSEMGNVTAVFNRHFDEMQLNVLEGTVEAERINVGTLANVSKVVGSLDLSANVNMRQTKDGGMDLDIDGTVHDVELLGNNLDQITLNGNLANNSFSGKVFIDDNDLDLDFNGHVDFSDPKALSGNFSANIDHADLRKLNLVKDGKALLKASINADVNNVNDFNNAEGHLSMKNVSFTNDNGNLVMQQLDASIVNDNLMQKRIDLDCDFLDFEMAGKMDFSTIVTAFKQFVYSYVEIPQWTEELEQFENSDKSSDQDFIVNLNVKDSKPITRLFAPSITIANNTSLNGTFTSRSKSLNLTMRSKYVTINNIKLNNIECKSLSSPRRSITRLNLDHLILRDSTESNPQVLGLDNVGIAAILQNDSIKAHLYWDDVDVNDHNKADLHMSFIPLLEGGHFNINKANIIIDDSHWTINPSNFIDINNDKIQVSNLELLNDRQSLKIDGMAPMTQDDTLSVTFDAFDISTFDFLLKGMGFDVDGYIYGNAEVSDLKNNMTLFADLNIKDLGLEGTTYGDVELFSQWNNAKEAVELDLGLVNQMRKALSLKGSFYPRRETDNLDFKLNIDSLNLSMASPFLSSVVQRLQGNCFGSLDIKGSLKQIDLQGEVKVKDGGCKVNFLNTYYTFAPTITLTNELISLKDLVLTDTLGNTARVGGQIRHNHFKDMFLDIKMYPNNFLAMATNASQSPSFYGTAIANGVVEAIGPVNNLLLDIKAMTRKGTVMTIPLGGNSNVKKHEFITFVDHTKDLEMEQDTVILEPTKKKDPSNLNIAMALNVNPAAQIKIALPNGLGSMEAKGDGNIKLGLATATGDMSLIGDYNISSGSLTLNIKDVIKRNFVLDPGSRISWTGDPVNGTINATGVYQTKVALSSLGLIDSTSMSSSNAKVECLVHIKNKLMNPEITFGLRLPNASEDLQMAVFNVIDTTNQSEMLMQAVSLLVFNSFSYGSNVNGYDLLTGQLNDFISQFTHDIDININYTAGDDLSNKEMTLDLRKQLFDDRLTIETNFGVVIPSNNYGSTSTNIIGDVNVDYKITKDGRWSAQVFNRSNYNTIYYQYTYYKMAPYTQGIGLSYKKSFDKFKDLFKKRSTVQKTSKPIIDRSSPLSKPKPNANGAN